MFSYRIILIVILIWVISFFSIIDANYLHYKNTLIGGRASTMAGAYSAIADDASGVYYNPAGIIYSPYQMGTDSANTLSFSIIRFDNVDGMNDWQLNSQSFYPNFFALVNKIGPDFAWGVSYVMTNIYNEHQQELTPYLTNSHREDRTVFLGPSFSYRISDQLSIGLTAYYFLRLFREQYSQYGRSKGELTVAGLGSDNLYLSDYGLVLHGGMPIIGMMWTLQDKFSLSGTVRYQFNGTSSVHGNRLSQSGLDLVASEFVDSISLLHKQDDYPIQLGLGGTYFASPFFLISADIDYFYQLDSGYDHVINVSVGTEYFIMQFQSIRLGVFTNNTSLKPPTSVSKGRQHIDLMGVTYGYSFYRGTTSLTIGGQYSFGKGVAQVYSGDSEIFDYYRSDWAFILAAGFGI